MTATKTAPPTTFPTLTPEEFKNRLGLDPELALIDVRSPAEYRGCHLAIATNAPLDTLDPDAIKDGLDLAEGKPLYVVCQAGGRSRKACQLLHAAGISVVNVDGGTPACEKAGVGVTRGKQAMSLERQVRIAAGSLVAVGTLLGVTVNPWLLVIPGFVGCGLVFAGVTDFCGMGMLIAKMPWSR